MVIQSDKELLVPIIIGITGHRDIAKENYKILENKIKEIVMEIKSLCTNSPIVLLSPLAEGADRIAARAALEIGIDLVAPLPMKREEYEATFLEESKVEFRELISKAKRYFKVPMNDSFTNMENDVYYENLGVFIAQNAHILIALWNGIENGKKGGTSQVVNYKLFGIPNNYRKNNDILNFNDSGSVYHIVTPRMERDDVIGEKFSINRKFPGIREDAYSMDVYNEKNKKAKIVYDKVIQQIDEFNKDIKNHLYKNINLMKKNIGYIIDEEKLKQADYETQVMVRSYGCADVLSLYYQNISTKAQKSLFILGVIAVLFFELYAHMFSYNLVLLLYPVTIILAGFFYYIANKNNIHNKYIDYRAIAEGFRVQIYWKLMEINYEVADYYLKKQKTELEWVRYVLRMHNIYKVNDTINKSVGSIESAKYVMSHWVEDQFKYYYKKSRQHKRNFESQERKINLFFFGGIATAIVLFLMELFEFEIPNNLHHLLIIIMGLAPAIAAAIGGYTNKMAFSEQQKRYKRMEEIFECAKNYLDLYINKENIMQVDEIIFEIGKDALLENGDWVILYREKPMALPKG
ncbi:hypothetical protein [Clostridium sp.]|uniref:hypothetical protein n=1 Tax=Clostridium sp. TaxID=1506 RepID=UPI00262FDC5A|nr:hypothetical protein [Clostridium sp.]